MSMDVRILDLDGALAQQSLVCEQASTYPAQDWGPYVRMACSFGTFRRLERALSIRIEERAPAITFLGSGDFHHVSLALLRRLRTPFNLLILDNHPDWMRGVPFMHCGTWVYHAARLPLLGTIFHAGGDVDFDNYYQWLTPWKPLRAGKIRLFPAVRRFLRRGWSRVRNDPLKTSAGNPLTGQRLSELLQPFRDDLKTAPLYISLDKDVMNPRDAVVNWDSGRLTLAEVQTTLEAFLEASGGRLAGMDVLGDWSPVVLRGALRQAMHFTEHPRLEIDKAKASLRNQETNLSLLHCIRRNLAPTKPRRAG
jgi:hypothetical protein